MAIDVRAEVTIDRPREEVAAFVMDAHNDTRWIGGISSAKILDGETVQMGTRVERIAHFMGKRIEYVNEVVEYAPPERLVMQSVKSPFPMRVTYAFEESGGRTVASVRVEGDASGFYRMAGPLMSRMVKRNITGDLERLKAILSG